jgi:hypothetical protein
MTEMLFILYIATIQAMPEQTQQPVAILINVFPASTMTELQHFFKTKDIKLFL